MKRWIVLLLLAVGSSWPAMPNTSAGAETPAQPAAGAPAAAGDSAAPPEAAIAAAKVDGRPIMVEDVNRALYLATQGRKADPEAIPAMQARMLEQLISRQLVVGYFTREKTGATEQEIDAAIATAKAELERQRVSLDDVLAGRKMALAAFREEYFSQLSWKKYVQANVTDAAIQAYFEAHHKDFDGTEMRVSHILLRVDLPSDAARKAAVEKADTIRRQIVDGTLTFAEAAARFSDGPSRREGGDQGFIPRHGLVAEPFAEAAFALEKGEFSPPVVTRYGVHLIQCTDIRPGKKPWTDSREALQNILSDQLFDKLVEKERKTAKIEYTGAMPYYKPGTRELVLPPEKKSQE
ncbi:MAG: peptidylprolyl isomerase [Pirellulales bacterium]